MSDIFRLLLLRHGKSSWDSPTKTDFDRSLNDRGIKDAAVVAEYISQECIPECIISSPALRAKQTCLQVCEKLNRDENSVQWQDDLYLASMHTLVANVSRAMRGCDSLLMIGHNPGFDELVDYLSADAVPLTGSGKLMTTAALAIIEIPRQTTLLAAKCGQLIALLRPTDLT